MKNTECEEGRSNIGGHICCPKVCKSLREFFSFEKVGEVKDNIGNEPSFYQSQKSASSVEATSSAEMGLRASYYTPGNHLNRDPRIN
jgi:hypothetical protein